MVFHSNAGLLEGIPKIPVWWKLVKCFECSSRLLPQIHIRCSFAAQRGKFAPFL